MRRSRRQRTSAPIKGSSLPAPGLCARRGAHAAAEISLSLSALPVELILEIAAWTSPNDIGALGLASAYLRSALAGAAKSQVFVARCIAAYLASLRHRCVVLGAANWIAENVLAFPLPFVCGIVREMGLVNLTMQCAFPSLNLTTDSTLFAHISQGALNSKLVDAVNTVIVEPAVQAKSDGFMLTMWSARFGLPCGDALFAHFPLFVPGVFIDSLFNNAAPCAARYGQTETLRAVIKRRRAASCHALVSAFETAIMYRQSDCVGVILEHLEPGCSMPSILLSNVAKLGDVKTLERLLEGGASPNMYNNEPLVFAVQESHADVVRILIKTGRVDCSVDDNRCLTMACENRSVEIVRMLLESGHLNVDKFGPAFVAAANKGLGEVVDMLVAARGGRVPDRQLRSRVRAPAPRGGPFSGLF